MLKSKDIGKLKAVDNSGAQRPVDIKIEFLKWKRGDLTFSGLELLLKWVQHCENKPAYFLVMFCKDSKFLFWYSKLLRELTRQARSPYTSRNHGSTTTQ